MKRVLFGIAALVLVGCATPYTAEETSKPIEYIYEAPGIDQEEIYKRSRLWIAESFVSAEAVTTFEDDAEMMIKGTGIGSFHAYMYERGYSYQLSIYTKPERARLVFSGFRERRIGDAAGADPLWYWPQIQEDVGNLAATYKTAITEGFSSDW